MTILGFVLKLSGIYPPELRSVNIDAKWVYRKGLLSVYRCTAGVVESVIQSTYVNLLGVIKRMFHLKLLTTGESSRMAMKWTVDMMVVSVVVLFAIFLVYLFGT